jgi:hypothetical protein
MESDTRSVRRYWKFGAVALLVTAFVMFYLSQRVPILRLASMVLLAMSVALVMSARRADPTTVRGAGDRESTRVVRSTRWWVGAGLLGFVASSRWLLDYAEAHDRWFPYPIYLYAVAIGALVWWVSVAFWRRP